MWAIQHTDSLVMVGAVLSETSWSTTGTPCQMLCFPSYDTLILMSLSWLSLAPWAWQALSYTLIFVQVGCDTARINQEVAGLFWKFMCVGLCFVLSDLRASEVQCIYYHAWMLLISFQCLTFSRFGMLFSTWDQKPGVAFPLCTA